MLAPLPLHRGRDRSLDLAATMDGLRRLLDAGVTDFLAHIRAPDSYAGAQDAYSEIVAAFGRQRAAERSRRHPVSHFTGPSRAGMRAKGDDVDDFETLLYEEKREDGVAIVTLNRPEVHNAFNLQMQEELRQVWRSLRTNDDVRAIVLTGAGEKTACTGIDRQEAIQEGFLENQPRPRHGPGGSPRRSCSTTRV